MLGPDPALWRSCGISEYRYEVLRLIRNCIQHEFEAELFQSKCHALPLLLQAVARIGVEGFKQLLICTGKNMKPNSWQKAERCQFKEWLL